MPIRSLLPSRAHKIMAATAVVVVVAVCAGWLLMHWWDRTSLAPAEDHAGYALGTEYMKYCESDRNPASPADKAAQMDFLRHTKVYLADQPSKEVALKFELDEPGSLRGAIDVLYLAGPSDHRCMFTAVRGSNSDLPSSELDKILRFDVGGRTYKPTDPDAPYCHSFAPPVLTKQADGTTQLTLRCDNRP